MIGSAYKRVHERELKPYRPFVYHERLSRFMPARFESYVWLSSLYDAVAATPEAFGDERSGSSTGGRCRIGSNATGDDEGD